MSCGWMTLTGTRACQCLSEPVSNALSYCCKKQGPFLFAAVVGTQYHPLFACGWWWSGRGGCKDNTHSAHILLFCYTSLMWSLLGLRAVLHHINLMITISVTQLKCDLNQQFDLFNMFYFKGPNNPNCKQTFSKFPPFALLPPDFERSVLKSFAAIQRTWMKYCCSRHRKNVPLTLDNPLNTLLTSEKRLTLLCGLSRLTLFSVGDSASRFFKIDIFNSLRKHRWHESLCTGVWTKYVLYILKLMHINSKLSAC